MQVKPLFGKGIKGGIAELFDNSIQATTGTGADVAVEAGGMHRDWRPEILVEFFHVESEDGEDQSCLVIQDNGVSACLVWGGKSNICGEVPGAHSYIFHHLCGP